MELKEQVTSYALAFVGVPYRYGGNNPLTGMDCSALCCEVLKSVGIIKGYEDFTAKELLKVLKDRGCKSTAPFVSKGCIVFFGRGPEVIEHVGIAVTNTTMVEAGGGDRGTISRERAEEQNAFVRIRPIRKDLVDCLLPSY